jgi:hypothetical protein
MGTQVQSLSPPRWPCRAWAGWRWSGAGVACDDTSRRPRSGGVGRVATRAQAVSARRRRRQPRARALQPGAAPCRVYSQLYASVRNPLRERPHAPRCSRQSTHGLFGAVLTSPHDPEAVGLLQVFRLTIQHNWWIIFAGGARPSITPGRPSWLGRGEQAGSVAVDGKGLGFATRAGAYAQDGAPHY